MLREEHNRRGKMSGNEFCKLVFNISQQLTTRDVEALKYIYRVNDENISNLRVLTTLESKGIFSSSNIQGLRTLLCNIERCDLLDMLKVVEDKRLELCYFQALSIEEKLEAIRADLMEFTGKQECSPTERLFCSQITGRVQKVQRDMKEFLTQPLKAVCTATECFSGGRPGNNLAAINGSKPAGGSSHRAMQTGTHIPQSQQLKKTIQINTHHNAFLARQVYQNQTPALTAVRDDDYDKLSPAGKNTSSTTSTDGIHYTYAYTDLVDGSQDPCSKCKQQPIKCKRNGKNNIAITDTRMADTRGIPSSLPNSVSVPLVTKSKVMKVRSFSEENLTAPGPYQGSNIPVPSKRLSPKSSLRKMNSEGSDIEASGSGDSGFCDPSEFALPPFKTDGHRSSSNTEHIYTKPNMLTVNVPGTYSVPMKRDKRH